MHALSLRIAWLSALTGQPASDSDLLRLLHGVKDAGSLQLAARSAGVSYRHAWGLLAGCARRLGQPLVVLERGRGAHLAPLGEKLLWADRRIAAALAPHLPRLTQELQREIEGVLAPRSLRMFASHDLVLARLRDLAAAGRRPFLEIQFRGSVDNLMALGRGECDLAGFHVSASAGGRLADPGLHRWLNPRSHVLIDLVGRRQGLMVRPGNPKRIRSLQDLTKRSVRFVNRQSGSGTRLAIDRLLENAAIPPGDVAGYRTEEFTHLAVAATVAGGMADAGFGIEAAAAQYHLEFIPILNERYLLACRQELLETAEFKRLNALLRSRKFRRIVGDLPGYDISDCGTVRSVGEVFDGAAAARSPSRRKRAAA